MPHELPPLPNAEDALEPHVAAGALRLHRQVHAGDVERLNRTLERTRFAELPIAETLTRLDEILDGPITAYRRAKVRAHGGSHLNHSLLWENLRPQGGPPPAGALAEAIERDIGSLDRLVDRMSRAALGLTGSGWAWLIHGRTGLAVAVTRDNDNPVMEGQVPLLALDMWEHAHLPQHGLDRRAHVEAFWPLVDWEAVARRLAAAEGSAAGPQGTTDAMDEKPPNGPRPTRPTRTCRPRTRSRPHLPDVEPVPAVPARGSCAPPPPEVPGDAERDGPGQERRTDRPRPSQRRPSGDRDPDDGEDHQAQVDQHRDVGSRHGPPRAAGCPSAPSIARAAIARSDTRPR